MQWVSSNTFSEEFVRFHKQFSLIPVINIKIKSHEITILEVKSDLILAISYCST